MHTQRKSPTQDQELEERRLNLLDLLFAPVSCLTHLSPIILLIIIGCIAILGVAGFYTLNTNFFGLVGPDFADYAVIGSYEGFQNANGETWQITYEFNQDSTFQGLVRQVYPVREGLFPMMTHDILVTSGEYADPDVVSVSVFNHHFTWRTTRQPPLQGAINLLHTVPLNDEIYSQLLKINKGDEVRISGREILRMNAIINGKIAGWWEDDGCNTLLVTAVEVIN